MPTHTRGLRYHCFLWHYLDVFAELFVCKCGVESDQDSMIVLRQRRSLFSFSGYCMLLWQVQVATYDAAAIHLLARRPVKYGLSSFGAEGPKTNFTRIPFFGDILHCLFTQRSHQALVQRIMFGRFAEGLSS